MKFAEFKFTLYDLFGYIFTGLVLITLIYISLQHFQKNLDLGKIFDGFSIILKKYAIIVVFSAYLLGHLISTFSFIIEKIISSFQRTYEKYNYPKNLLSSGIYNVFSEKYKKIFNSEYETKDFVWLTSYVESKQPLVYATAFVFLSFYGMSRCLAFSFFIFSIFEMIACLKCNVSCSYAFFSFFIAVIFLSEYFKFYGYYRQKIITGFTLPE